MGTKDVGNVRHREKCTTNYLQSNKQMRLYHDLTIVYAKKLFSDWELLWQQLINMHEHIDDAWILIGGFNNVLKPKDKKGGLSVLFHISKGLQIV